MLTIHGYVSGPYLYDVYNRRKFKLNVYSSTGVKKSHWYLIERLDDNSWQIVRERIFDIPG